jgi:DNA-binding NarL/FixJ family response regulator
LDAIAPLHGRCPDMPVVVMSSNEDRDTVMRALDHGAMGFIPKTSNADTMIAALRLVLVGGIYLPPAAFLQEARSMALPATPSTSSALPVGPRPPAALQPSDLGLSPRQSEVLRLILQGKSAKAIARELSLGTSTVKSHTGAVLRALNVTTRTQAVIAASRLGLRLHPR